MFVFFVRICWIFVVLAGVCFENSGVFVNLFRSFESLDTFVVG